MHLHVVDYPFPVSCNFFLDFSAAKLLRYNELLRRIETKNTNSAKHDLSLSANGMVFLSTINCAFIYKQFCPRKKSEKNYIECFSGAFLLWLSVNKS